ncbi:hypothetical protein H6F76_20375 [Leptolyngbya sp. FACHB-321]|uniref:hypothetical protein n=1 Tax=Leptolyngbya sp. FACHB-321 TaxID=2692807 RepID=UPI001689DEB3|nr:hypothetical protein [Leptolyngbya sp. FACHB-321]MBD2037324.1 hypothetical protein [Leptolyngbya sp. FACHB-321]
MAVEPRLTSDDISFADAIAVTQALLNDLEQGNVDAFGATVRELVRSENGARGFFVTYLSDDRPLADHLTPTLIAALQTSPAIVAPLLIKNLVMSTAMAMTHRRNQNEDLVQGSARVRSRTTQLIQALQLPQVQAEAQSLLGTIATKTGDYQAFLERWGYDLEQQQAMQQTLIALGFAQ